VRGRCFRAGFTSLGYSDNPTMPRRRFGMTNVIVAVEKRTLIKSKSLEKEDGVRNHEERINQVGCSMGMPRCLPIHPHSGVTRRSTAKLLTLSIRHIMRRVPSMEHYASPDDVAARVCWGLLLSENLAGGIEINMAEEKYQNGMTMYAHVTHRTKLHMLRGGRQSVHYHLSQACRKP
jgi:hypothetical protein